MKHYRDINDFGLEEGYNIIVCIEHSVLLEKDQQQFMCLYSKDKEGYTFGEPKKCENLQVAENAIKTYLGA